MPGLPTAFVARMHALLGTEEASALCSALDTPAPTTIRLAQHRSYPINIVPSKARPVPWCPWGYYLPSRPTFTGDAALHGGGYYVQEASSMLLYAARTAIADEPVIALDLCAAPGGKSTLLLDMLAEGSIVVSNEVVRHRANILTENIQKWGSPYSVVTTAMPDRLGKLEDTFDLLLVDAPCSGEGMFRKDHSAREEWTPTAPASCAQRQRSILRDIWPALRPGGTIIYSTCTFSPEENEDIVDYITELGATAIELDGLYPSIMRSPYSAHPCYRMMPHRVEGEGLFMAILRKDDTEAHQRQPKRQSVPRADIPREMLGWITPTDYIWERNTSHEVIAYPAAMATLLSALRALRIPILSAGVPIGQIKGKSLIPHHALALSQVIDRNSFAQVELDEADLIPYLSREAVTLDTPTPGLKLITHMGIPLGFAKHLGNRSNNLYPAEWRIRHGERLQRERGDEACE